jgi:hypothetical protein
VTDLADLISRADRERLEDRRRELAELDVLMRQRGTLAGPDEPPALHRTGRREEDR